MTREELEKNLEAGREWLKRNGFHKDIGTTWKWVEGLEIDEPDMTDETSVREYIENEELWVCWASFDSEANDEHTQSYGRTPKAAMEEALREWDEEMARRRHNLFAPISECIQEAPDYERLDFISGAAYGLYQILNGQKIVLATEAKALAFAALEISKALDDFKKRLQLIFQPKELEDTND